MLFWDLGSTDEYVREIIRTAVQLPVWTDLLADM
jgi:hypothetical protein